MIYLLLPLGSNFGWGVCGKYITKELSFITDVKLITISDPKSVNDELDYFLIKSKLVDKEELSAIKNKQITRVDYPVLTTLNNINFLPVEPSLRGSKTIGYTFFEDNALSYTLISNAKASFDLVVTGSKWCEEVLRSYNYNSVETIIQGVDTTVFNPYLNQKEYFKDKFVIFSGGKFEFRKGQDLVIRAYKALQDKYDDVMLVNSWFNQWKFSLDTMASSKYIKFNIKSNNFVDLINNVLIDNGIDISRVITLPALSNHLMPKIYRNTDLGLFSNRCEGGTNLVLMEYMACGKPVIASYNSGHKDILTPKNSIRLETMSNITITKDNKIIANWEEPQLDELISYLEWAYNNRDRLEPIAGQAGNDMAQITWKETAEQFYKVLT